VLVDLPIRSPSSTTHTHETIKSAVNTKHSYKYNKVRKSFVIVINQNKLTCRLHLPQIVSNHDSLKINLVRILLMLASSDLISYSN